MLMLWLAGLLAGCTSGSDDTEDTDGGGNGCTLATAFHYYPDADADGLGSRFNMIPSCAVTPPAGYVDNSDDCNDGDVAIGGPTSMFVDGDGDGFGGAAEDSCGGDGFTAIGGDCNDDDILVNPDRSERCNGVDDDCNGSTDVDAVNANEWFQDVDGDGFGNPASSQRACDAPAGFVDDGSDCNDGDDAIHPGAPEVCNGADDDCDGGIDVNARDAGTWYEDSDHDGFGGQGIAVGCSAPTGFVADGTDCDDSDRLVNPDADEICNDVDDDCDGETNTGATDASTFYRDADGDGLGDNATTIDGCTLPSGYVANATDCDDTDRDVLLTRSWYVDSDGDGFGAPTNTPRETCIGPAGYVLDDTDCDDADRQTHPGGVEHCDLVDEDCDGVLDNDAVDPTTYYLDDDGDTYGEAGTTTEACSLPAGYSNLDTDCDDGDDAQYPGATEVCNVEDDDCDGRVDDSATGTLTWYADNDSDGYGTNNTSVVVCIKPGVHYSLLGDDCDDGDSSVHPDAIELCDSIDQDCDGLTRPSGAEIPCNRIDDDCSGGDASDAIVDASGVTPNSVLTIEDAIAAASNGDWICVEDGVYTGEILVDKRVNIRAYGGSYLNPTATIEGTSLPNARAVKITASNALLDGFIITGGNEGDDGGAILVDAADSVTISNCEVTASASSQKGGGIAVRSSNGVKLSDLYVHDNSASGDGGGVSFDTCDDAVVTDSVFDDNTALDGGGVWAQASPNLQVLGASFTGNVSALGGGGLGLLLSDGVGITQSTFTDNDGGVSGGGINASSDQDLSITDDVFTGNHVGVVGGAVAIASSASPNLSTNTFDSNSASFAGPPTSYGFGGAVGISTSDDALIDGNAFTDNVALVGGGGLYVSDCDRTDVSNNGFARNAAAAGGAATFSTGVDGTSSNNDYNRNTADSNGSAVYLNAVLQFAFDTDSFEGNTSPEAALYCDGNAVITSTFTTAQTTFTNNAVSDVACESSCTSPSCPP